ncbi:hypothetical protein P5G51_005820 [Virgibacillus sp. 179-BFC.A HS]|uniref:Spore germination protein gerPA/gerPF n=1 Tax=Tigheibacillus jepli TaxID=3035914 RepID=A0ABU5CGI5_9BACI|nr:hypothetical protein [Virgibacillus sp. 179-BFC.A HS]MDY0404982.1 hypothetical protein [Virgibacillus sp. 179-BFC.A HS]
MTARKVINLRHVKIGVIDGSSSMSLGKAHQTGNNLVNHRNEGFGEQNADGVITSRSISLVDDADFVDSNTTKKDPTIEY